MHLGFRGYFSLCMFEKNTKFKSQVPSTAQSEHKIQSNFNGHPIKCSTFRLIFTSGTSWALLKWQGKLTNKVDYSLVCIINVSKRKLWYLDAFSGKISSHCEQQTATGIAWVVL